MCVIDYLPMWCFAVATLTSTDTRNDCEFVCCAAWNITLIIHCSITELQSCASAPVRVRTINEVQGGIKAPIEECAWRAGAALVDKIHAVPRAQYDEEGKQALARSLLFN